jgi:hypothetical protein
VHIFVDIGGSPIRLGRADAMRKVRLRFPAVTSLGTRLVIVPEGRLGSFRGSGGESGLYSETLSPALMLDLRWRFSGSTLSPIGGSGGPR